MLVTDVDGVLTAGGITYDSQTHEIKQFNAKDGFGFKLAHSAGLLTGIISARESQTIRHRAGELGIKHLYLGRYDKWNALQELKAALKLADDELCYLGDDLPDIPVLSSVGLPVAVADADEQVRVTAGFVTHRKGGEGAIRETVELILFAQNRLISEKEKWFEKQRNKK